MKASINANCANFTDFDSVKDAYVEFKHTENPTNDPRTRQVASVAHGGHGGGNFPHKHYRGQGPQTFDKCQKGLVPQSELDKQTHIRYGARVHGTKTYIFNPSLRLVLYQFLHTVSLCHHETIHYTQQTATNTVTMVAEPLALPVTRI